MQVLLLENVRSLGKKYEVVSVPDGFANNNLIPRKLALPANSPQAKQLVKKAREKAGARAEDLKKTQQQLKALKMLTLTGSANDKSVLYKAVSADVVSKLLQEKHGLDVSPKAITLPGGGYIKETGEYPITIRIDGQDVSQILQIVQPSQ